MNTKCDRCHAEIKNYEHWSLGPTAGYYHVGNVSYWSRFAIADEQQICDQCMWEDPKYQMIYGTHQ